MRVVVNVAVARATRVSYAPASGSNGRLVASTCRPMRAQQLGEHVVGLELQAIGAHLERHVAVAEVIRGAQQVERRAVRAAQP